MTRPNIDTYFVDMAELVSTRSRDPSTKTGAVLVHPDGYVISTGYNGFATSMPDSPENYENRDEKYSRIIHCEMNALIFAKQSLEGATLYTWPFMSCDRCVVHMIQAGVKRFVAPRNEAPRWVDAFKRVRAYVAECGCELVEV